MVFKQEVPPCLPWLLIFNFEPLGQRLAKVKAPFPTVGAAEHETVIVEIERPVDAVCKMLLHARGKR